MTILNQFYDLTFDGDNILFFLFYHFYCLILQAQQQLPHHQFYVTYLVSHRKWHFSGLFFINHLLPLTVSKRKGIKKVFFWGGRGIWFLQLFLALMLFVIAFRLWVNGELLVRTNSIYEMDFSSAKKCWKVSHDERRSPLFSHSRKTRELVRVTLTLLSSLLNLRHLPPTEMLSVLFFLGTIRRSFLLIVIHKSGGDVIVMVVVSGDCK